MMNSTRVALAASVLLALPGLAVFAAPGKAVSSRQSAVSKRAAKAVASATVQYNRDVRPILSDNCFACHGPDKNKRLAGFRLDVREDALKKGAIVPGKPEKSPLVERVFSADDAVMMPPAAFHKKLTPGQKETLKRWVAQGAKYEAHWAYIVPKRPAVPVLKDPRYASRNPIDAFIRERLAKEHILPSAEADRRTLIRRVYLDLTGIPPAPQDVSAFLGDKSANAYEKVVDKLLASPHYGERMAIPWLDVVRYADTVGFHGDQNQNAWAYRDYVVNSFNKNKPFDQFATEQLAGDLLPHPTPEQLTATCFNRLNMMTREGGAQAKEYLAKYQADRVRTVGMAFLGSTLACCECHDHKYDPFTARDFYSMGAFFADLKQWGVYADYGYTPNPDLKGYNNDYPFPPEIKVESPYLKERMGRDQARITQIAGGAAAGMRDDAAAANAFEAWRAASVDYLAKHPDGWETPAPEVETAPASARPKRAKGAPKVAAPSSGKLAEFRVEKDGVVTLTDAVPADLELALKPDAGKLAALRLELLPGADKTIFRPGMNSAMLTLTAQVHRADGKSTAVQFRHAGANFAEPRYRSGFEIVGVQSGWKIGEEHKAEKHDSVWLPAAPVKLNQGDEVVVTLPGVSVAHVRVSVSPFVPEDPDSTALPLLRAAMDSPNTFETRPLLLREYLLSSAYNQEAFKRATTTEADLTQCYRGTTPVMVAEAAAQPMTMRILPRGNWQDESGPIVTPHVPQFLDPTAPNAPMRRQTRLDLAEWIVSPSNPLTARVQVNRLWKQFFGTGLSAQVEDLGAQGEMPTHPELLDWLAVEFRESGWDVKHMVRLMVTSATYKQSSNLRPELRNVDPQNRLLASQNPRRLEAELVRDNALAIAGLLNTDVGGPPVHPYQPAGYYVNIQFPDRDYVSETDEREWRRGLYMHWQRTFVHPMLVNFDAPSREDCIAARNVSNTPQQALTLLNDPEFLEAARVFAQDLIAAKAMTDAERIDQAYQRALCRPAKEKERQSLLAFLEKVRAAYRERPEDAKKILGIGYSPSAKDADPTELAAWTSVCRVVLNLQETITRY